MFSKDKNSRSVTEISKEQNKIAQGTTVVGDLVGRGGFRIDGSVEGSIKTPGKVVVGKEGKINGNLNCENADIEGKFTGKLTVSGVLTLRSTAVLDGEVTTSKLAVEPGANFNATCTMAGVVKTIRNEKSEEGKKEKSA